MSSAAAIRLQVETTLARRIPSALTPAPKIVRPVAPTGVAAVDALLEGGLPMGAITEFTGPECSGRTSLALSFVAGVTRAGHVGAWIDVSNMLQPESAAAAGVDLARLLWVRCGDNPRSFAGKPWLRIEQALRAADLLLQGGGFSVLVLDMAGIAAEHASRVPLATWFRYRAAAERAQANVLLLTQHACAKSSGELLLRFQPGEARQDEATVFTGIEHRLDVERRRFTQTPNNVILMRKPPQSTGSAHQPTHWRSQSTWAGPPMSESR